MLETRITKKFSNLKKQNRTAFIPFITAGDPDLHTTEKLVYVLEECGASIIELGVPFSDPMADGPTIQKANERALKNAVGLKDILQLVKKIRRKTQIPLLLMGYYNPILQYGLERFAKDCVRCGVDAVLTVDLPVEESGDLRLAFKDKPINMIYLLTPTSDRGRVDLVKRYGSGFVYYVSFTGVTGAKRLKLSPVKKNVIKIQRQTVLPVAVGFGISKPSQVKEIATFSDGVVVGSFLVKEIEKAKTQKQKLLNVANAVSSLTRSL